MWIPRFFTLIALLSIPLAQPVHAAHWQLGLRLCPFELIEIPQVIEPLPIPIGCEVIDCCPGCPGPGPLQWNIRIDGTTLQGARLRFDGLSGGQLESLKLSGNARLEKGSLFFGPGESTISGLPFPTGKRVPVGFLEPIIDQKMVERARQGDPDVTSTGEQDSERLQILQFRERFVVNRFRIGYALRRCPAEPVVEDMINVTNNLTVDSMIILADTRRSSGCQNDDLYRTTNEVGIGNALSPTVCNSEVSVFSDDNAMSFEPNVSWTDSPGDVHTANLQPILNVPVSVWVANAGSLAAATNDVANANLLYNQNNVGVQFTPTFNNVSGNAAAVATIGNGCVNAAAVQGSAWYTANTLNAYYVGGAFTGVNCGFDRNINYIGTTANLGSLPHEFGHAYGLRPSAAGGHTNGLAGFGNNNIMWGGGPGTRNNFSVGQSFRMNVHSGSMLNANGNRTGATRSCPPNQSDAFCPALSLDSLPH